MLVVKVLLRELCEDKVKLFIMEGPWTLVIMEEPWTLVIMEEPWTLVIEENSYLVGDKLLEDHMVDLGTYFINHNFMIY